MTTQGYRSIGPWRRALHLAGIAAVATRAVSLIAAPAKPAQKLFNVADTRDMVPGFSRWLADVYNGSLWEFGALVVVTMVVMGVGLGMIVDRLVGLLGIDLGRLTHHE